MSGNVIEIDLITEAITIIAGEDVLFSWVISRGNVKRSTWCSVGCAMKLRVPENNFVSISKVGEFRWITRKLRLETM